MKIIRKKDFEFFLICVALCSAAGLFSGFSWFFDLFNHFRPQAVIAAAALLVPFLFYKGKSYILLAIGVIALNAALMGMRIDAFERNTATDVPHYLPAPLTILSANVHTSNTHYAAAIDLVLKKQPDIFVAIEVDGAWTRNLEKIEADYPYSLKQPADDNFGMAIYAKIPFDGSFRSVGHDYRLPLFYGDFGSFSLIAMHPIPPVDALDAKETKIYIAEGARLAQETKKPLIIAGDLNATLWSDNIKPLIKAGLSSTHPSGIAWTWPTGFMPLAVQIDHIFVRDALARSFNVLNDIGSDHFPIMAEISLPLPRNNGDDQSQAPNGSVK